MGKKRVSEYVSALADLLAGRSLKTLSEEDEASLMEKMDDLWWSMTQEERKLIDRELIDQGRRGNDRGTRK